METLAQELKKRVRKPSVKKNSQGADAKISISPEAIGKKAYELYEKRGRQNGSAEQDWLEAERILKAGVNEDKGVAG